LNRLRSVVKLPRCSIKRCITLLLFLILTASAVQGQSKARGFSAAGSIGKVKPSSQLIPSGSEIVCTVSYRDSSGDDILNVNEKAEITIFVRNYSKSSTIRPKLEIQLRWELTSRPVLRIESMDPLPPGQGGTFTDQIIWNEDLPPGGMSYKVRVFDSVSGLRSQTAQINFQIQSKVTN
jgi:hypothetical protein